MSQSSSVTSSPRAPRPWSRPQRFVERLAVGDAGQGIGHAFLAHIVELGAKFADLLRGGLQFAFQALGALSMARVAAISPSTSLRRSAGLRSRAQLAGGGRQRVLVVWRCRGPSFPACPSCRRSARPYCRPALPSRWAARAPDRQRRRRSASSSGVKGALDSIIAPITWAMAGIFARGIGIEQFEILWRRRQRRRRPSTRAPSWRKPVRGPCLNTVTPLPRLPDSLTPPLCKKR